MTRRGIALTVFLGAIVLLIALYLVARDDGNISVNNAAADQGSTKSSLRPGDKMAQLMAPTTTPSSQLRAQVEVNSVLPPVDSKLADMLERLKVLAGNGSGAAACRLGFELDRCGAYERFRTAQQDEEDLLSGSQLNNDGKAAALVRLGQLKKLVGNSGAVCADINPSEFRNAWKYIFQAAMAGDSNSMLQFSAGKGLRLVSEPAAAPEAWIAYRDHALGFLESALAQGRPEALTYLAQAYTRPRFGSRLAEVDAKKAATYLYALLSLTPADSRQSVQREIDALAEEFKTSKLQLDEANSESVAISTSLKRKNPLFDGSKNLDSGVDGSHCNAVR